ncbi:AAA family ATPase [Diaminobutyricibacter tongyongensis]|uniref:Nuclease SbcCD subunit C n=1 Tax=Leifsonia tongyongensis TaxID=1268043 RepID=A0A6L9XXU3_9MICO|nr:AAA family ATPase [Diaminobutyricibacter tongyongensis]NEN05854.1 AAA family ATPase [Diaminobutyricibacter tongyongensis]
MKILELGLLNWGPYEGAHTLPLDVSPEAPVVLIRGENMRGKTSLLRAIVWCMYGAMKQQDGRTPFELSRMVNWGALELNSADFEVSMKAEHRGEQFELTRSGRATTNSFGETHVESVKVSMLVAGKTAVAEKNIRDILDGILSEQISDFYFFDGEMLNRFEERLREDKESTRRFVRDQVERALGLPFLAALKTDLDDILATLSYQIQKIAKGSKKAVELQNELAEIEQLLGVKSRDVAELTSAQEVLRLSIERLDAELESAADIRESFYRRKSLEREVEIDTRDLEDYRLQLSGYADKNWWFPLAKRLRAKSDIAANKLQQARGIETERIRLSVQLEALENQRGDSHCQSCGQLMPHDHLADLDAREAAVLARLDELNGQTDLEGVQLEMSRLADFAGGTALQERIVDIEDDIRRLKMRLDRKRSEIRGLDEILGGSNLEIASLEAQRRSEKDKLAEYGQDIEKAEEDTRILRARRTELRSEIGKLPEVDPLDRKRMKVYSEAVEVVGNSFEEFRSSMRAQIESQASEIFRTLTTEKDYTGVLLREDYSLAVLDDDGRPMNNISAGANQVLTMSFIGALSKLSADAPMVMDTPLGRLDKGHRASILRWVASMPTQAIIFVQSGEYDPATDAELLGGKIGREFVIERISANNSQVVPA